MRVKRALRLGSGSGVDSVMGDARLSLERELKSPDGPRRYHVLVVDAFSGDAIPDAFAHQRSGRHLYSPARSR